MDETPEVPFPEMPVVNPNNRPDDWVAPQRPVDIPLDPSVVMRPSKYNCLIYHYYTGEIRGNFDVPSPALDDWLEYHSTNHLMFAGDPLTQYVDIVNKVLIDRPENPAALDGGFIRNVPSPTIPAAIADGPIEGVQLKTTVLVSVNGSNKWQFFETEDDEIELDFAPGSYKVEIRAFPYKNKIIEVTI